MRMRSQIFIFFACFFAFVFLFQEAQAQLAPKGCSIEYFRVQPPIFVYVAMINLENITKTAHHLKQSSKRSILIRKAILFHIKILNWVTWTGLGTALALCTFTARLPTRENLWAINSRRARTHGFLPTSYGRKTLNPLKLSVYFKIDRSYWYMAILCIVKIRSLLSIRHINC